MCRQQGKVGLVTALPRPPWAAPWADLSERSGLGAGGHRGEGTSKLNSENAIQNYRIANCFVGCSSCRACVVFLPRLSQVSARELVDGKR